MLFILSFLVFVINAYQVDNSTLVGLEYRQTSKGVFFTEYVTLAKLVNNIYYPSKTIHSSKLVLHDTIMWPGKEFSEAGNLVFTIEHYVVNKTNTRCCIGIEVGVPDCEIKACCGTGCCCDEISSPLICANVLCGRSLYKICCPDGSQASCNCRRNPVCTCG